MGYSVIVRFKDLQDGGRIYNVGDAFPGNGSSASEERLSELASNRNKIGVPLIKKEAEPEMPVKKKGARKRAERGAGLSE